MNNKLPRFLRPSMRLYFILLVFFAALTFVFGPDDTRAVAYAEVGVIILLALYTRFESKRRAAKLAVYIESVTLDRDSAAHSSLTLSPLPAVIFSSKSCNILWSNDLFRSLTADRDRLFEVRVTDLVPDFSSDWLREGKTECPRVIAVDDRNFKVYGSLSRLEGDERGGDFLATTYWVDVTEYNKTSIEYAASRPVYATILLDNYEDLLRGLSEREKSALLSDIDQKISNWTGERDGYLCKYDRDRYLYIFEVRHLDGILGDKFKVLEDVHACVGSGGIHATLSIGIGKDGATPFEAARNASLALEMALTRGGDQAVIKNNLDFVFFGGNAAETEKRTKVKSRVMSNALGELISDSTNVFVMSHKNADFDAVGSAAGIVRVAKSRGVPAYIVMTPENTLSEQLIAHLRTEEDYANVFISAEQAMLRADRRSLLVVTDTSRPEETESPALLESIPRVVVIDHPRRAATYIENAVLNFNEPYASSASELVTEILQYLVAQNSILHVEADALLAGIVLDTKTFAIRTGSRTFDAAAFLRRLGADTIDVKMLMQSDFDTAMHRYSIVRDAQIYRDGIAIASSESNETRVIIAQAADELLNIAGVTASFVTANNDGAVFISGRSLGGTNVQLILEKLGGGGNQSIAGGRIDNVSVDAAVERLQQAIDQYLKENA
ncbi:MAG: DHH family phosphoesterase [Oscillospiraceae bacterium]|jgi:c-di-AMP phosphodiesterase-like protein|nr:DHH family phosphoesterase [Oscillospiraceae bacterium]